MTIPTAFVWFGNFNESCGWMFCFFPAPFAWTTFCVWWLGWWTLNSTVFKNLMERKVSGEEQTLRSIYRYIKDSTKCLKFPESSESSEILKIPPAISWLLGFLGPPLNTQPALSRSFTQSDWKIVSQNLRHTFTAKVFVVSAVSPLHWIRCICPMPVYIWPTTRHPLEHGSEESMIWITEVRFTRSPLTKTNNSLQLLCHFYNMLQLLKLDIWLVISFFFWSDVSCPWPWILQLYMKCFSWHREIAGGRMNHL